METIGTTELRIFFYFVLTVMHKPICTEDGLERKKSNIALDPLQQSDQTSTLQRRNTIMIVRMIVNLIIPGHILNHKAKKSTKNSRHDAGT